VSQSNSIRPKFSLLAASRHIGWGGVGKLRLILEKLPCAHVVLHGDEQTIALKEDFLGSRHKFDAQPPPQIDVALVINDPIAANNIADLNVPVVYVDSLPYMRKTDDDIPERTKVAYYCAQKYPIDLLPLTSPLLRNWQDIKWIDPIVPIPQSRRGGRGIVINVGGLYTYSLAGLPIDLANEAVDAYLKLVLFPLVDLLQRSDRKISAICGNINADTCRQLRSMVPSSIAVGPQSPYAFERLLTDADLLITSPGSTTILQAVSINLPTLLLPSQNRSQFFNAQIYSNPHADVMQWPDSVLDLAGLEQQLSKGLVALNSYIYKSIIDAAASQDLCDEVSMIIRKAVFNAPDDGVLNPRLSGLGIAGADQVAQLVMQVALRHQSIMADHLHNGRPSALR
jgi:hydroxymethylcytosylglucuronate/cytosylglucuronate synthase